MGSPKMPKIGSLGESGLPEPVRRGSKSSGSGNRSVRFDVPGGTASTGSLGTIAGGRSAGIFSELRRGAGREAFGSHSMVLLRLGVTGRGVAGIVSPRGGRTAGGIEESRSIPVSRRLPSCRSRMRSHRDLWSQPFWEWCRQPTPTKDIIATKRRVIRNTTIPRYCNLYKPNLRHGCPSPIQIGRNRRKHPMLGHRV